MQPVNLVWVSMLVVLYLLLHSQSVSAAVSISTVAGQSTPGSSDGTGTAASMYRPRDIQLSSDNTFAIFTTFDGTRVRKLDVATGAVTTIAGQYTSSSSADGTGTAARFRWLESITLSSDDTFALVVDRTGSGLRRIDLSTSVVTTVVGTLNSNDPGSACGVVGAGAIAGTAAILYHAIGLALSHDDSFALFSDYRGRCIRKYVLATGYVTTIAGTTTAGDADGTGANAQFTYAYLMLDSTSSFAFAVNLYTNKAIRKLVIATGVVTTVATMPVTETGEGRASGNLP